MEEQLETTATEDGQAGLVPGEEHVVDEVQTESSTVVEEEQPKKKNGVQERIDKLTREKYERERENAYLRGQLEASQKQPEPVVEQQLDPNDFDSTGEYLQAVEKRLEEKITKQHEADQKAKEESEINATIGKAIQAGRDKYEDFNLVTGQNIYTPTMQQAAIGENMAEIMYHLGKHPDESLRIAALPAHLQAKEIGRIEAVLTTKPPKPPANVTNAADPPPKVPTGGAPSGEPQTFKEKMAQWDAERLAGRR